MKSKDARFWPDRHRWKHWGPGPEPGGFDEWWIITYFDLRLLRKRIELAIFQPIWIFGHRTLWCLIGVHYKFVSGQEVNGRSIKSCGQVPPVDQAGWRGRERRLYRAICLVSDGASATKRWRHWGSVLLKSGRCSVWKGESELWRQLGVESSNASQSWWGTL